MLHVYWQIASLGTDWWRQILHSRPLTRSRGGISAFKLLSYSWRQNLWDPLVFVNFSAQDASILKITVPISKRRSWGFQNTPNLQSSDYFEPSYSNLKKMEDLQKLGSYSILDKQFLCHFVFAVFLANTHQKLDFWGCFGILRISSWWWAQRF